MLAFVRIGKPPKKIYVRIFRIDANGFAVVSNGFVMLAFVRIGKPPIVVRLCIFGIDVKGFAVVSNGFVMLAFFYIGKPPRLQAWHDIFFLSLWHPRGL